jgi:glycosyltransferase involved in cell wall biosynthesis
LSRVCCAKGIEYAGTQNLYGWKVAKDELSIETLFSGAIEDRALIDIARSWRKLWRTLDSWAPSTILIPGYTGSISIVAAVWALMHKTRTILMFETTEGDKSRNWAFEFLKSMLIRALFRRAFVGGSLSARYLAKLNFPPASIARKYDVVDNDFFSIGTSKWRREYPASEVGLPNNFFLCVARLAEEKNGRRLLEAFKNYRNEGGDWGLVVVGKGPLEDSLKSYALQNDLQSSAIFAGFKNGEELLPYYALAKCFVLASTREPWGLVVNEAMASGLPVLVSEVCGCVPELIKPGENGYTFNPYNVSALTKAMHSISSLDRIRLAKMGAASAQIISEYSPTDWANSVLSLAGSNESSMATQPKPLEG